MNASSTGIESADLTAWAGLFPMNAATPITCVHLGIEYCGEVVRVKRWWKRPWLDNQTSVGPSSYR